MTSEIIKRCPFCGEAFTLDDIRRRRDLVPLGMVFEGGDFSFNLYYFTHDVEGCGTTLAIPVEDLIDLIEEPIPAEALTGSEVCEARCININDLDLCHAECRYAPFRRLLLRLKDRE